MEFSLTILGSGGAAPTPERHPTAQCLQVGNQSYLIDAGEGVQMRMLRFGISHARIRHIFISHLHGDHYLGLMGLIFSMHLGKRQEDLHVYSHRGLDELILLHLRHARSTLTFRLHFHFLTEGQEEILMEDDNLTVKAIPLNHRLPCSGFLFREKDRPRKLRKELLPEGVLLQHLVRLKAGETILDESGKVLMDPERLTWPPPRPRSYAFCSDTAWFDELPRYVNGVNLLYHEATFHSNEIDKARETFHSTARQAAQVASSAGVERLLIGHLSGRYKNQDVILDEARAVFPATDLAIEGQVHRVPD